MSKLKYDESFAERAGECAAKGLNNIRTGQMHCDHRNLSRRRFPQNHRTPASAQSKRSAIGLRAVARLVKRHPLKDTPKSRNRAAARLIMLAAWAKQPPLKDTAKSRNASPTSPPSPTSTLLKSTPKSRNAWSLRHSPRPPRLPRPPSPMTGGLPKCREKSASDC